MSDFIFQSDDGTSITLEGTPDQDFIIDGGEQGPRGPMAAPSVVEVAQSATPAINLSSGNIFNIVGLAQDITSMTSGLTGAMQDGQKVEIRFRDDGSAHAINWGASFQDTSVTKPSSTIPGRVLRTGWEWNSVAAKLDCIAVA